MARRSAKRRDPDPPWLQPGERIKGEVTTDGGIHRRVTPRIVVDRRDLPDLLKRCPWLAGAVQEVD